MKSISALLILLLAAGSLAVQLPHSDETKRDKCRQPAAAETETVILTEDGGGDHAEPSPEEIRNAELV
jgi:hypothetical protein